MRSVRSCLSCSVALDGPVQPERVSSILMTNCSHERIDAGILLVVVSLGVLIGPVGCDLGGDFLGDQPLHAISVSPRDVAEVVVEGLDDVRETIKFRFWLAPPARGRHWADLGVLVSES